MATLFLPSRGSQIFSFPSDLLTFGRIKNFALGRKPHPSYKIGQKGQSKKKKKKIYFFD